mgnify:CR=1 FL=1
MFKDTKEELDRLQQELLQEQATQVFTPVQDPRETSHGPNVDDILNDPELQALMEDTVAAPPQNVAYRNFANDYGEERGKTREPEPVPRRKEKGNRGLIIADCLLAGGIVLVVLWWVLRLSGIL